MATWKENGVVPDSDDEGGWDSQSTTSQLSERKDVEGSASYGKHSNAIQLVEKENIEGLLSQRSATSSNIGNGSNGGAPDGRATNSKPAAPAGLERLPVAASSSFRTPLKLLEGHDYRHHSFERRTLPFSNKSSKLTIPDDLPASPSAFQDDISRTYVQLSSPLSSLGSLSPSRDTLEVVSNQDGALGNAQLLISGSNGDLGDAFNISDDEEENRIVDRELTYEPAKRRSLRHRNPIQLHPYALEGEKYRQTLMARGLKPLRITQGHKEAESTVQNAYSHDAEFEPDDDGQIPTFEESLQHSSSFDQVSPYHSSNRFLNPFNNIRLQDEDDFPDIEALVDQQHAHVVRSGPKRRITSYGRTGTLHKHTGHSTRRQDPVRNATTPDVDIFDIPPSPPETSPILPALPAGSPNNMRSSRSPTLFGRSSFQRAPPQGSRIVREPLSPVTSTIKNTIDLTTRDDSDALGNSFDFGTESEASSISSRLDESLDIRRVVKKIRGVLPASWLRLDQQANQPQKPRPVSRDANSLSPIKTLRRGVAFAKPPVSLNSNKPAEKTPDTFFMSDESGDEDNLQFRDSQRNPVTSLRTMDEDSQSDVGYVFEDNRIDSMFPSKKRQAKLLPSNYRRKKQAMSKTLFKRNSNASFVQPKITDHLPTPQSFEISQKHESRKRESNKQDKPTYQRVRTSQSKASNLSIFDVVSPSINRADRPPQFVRIALRNAKSRRAYGRRSPSGKFVRLANRKDTQEAQAVLQAWRDGTLRPREQNAFKTPPENVRRKVQQTKLPPPQLRVQSRSSLGLSFHGSVPHEISVLKTKQTAISEAENPENSRSNRDKLLPKPVDPPKPYLELKSRRQKPKQPHQVRPAQLEILEADERHPGMAFQSRKKILDALYRKRKKKAALPGDIQLSRFLTDDDIILHELNLTSPITVDHLENSEVEPAAIRTPKPSRPKKRVPQRIDAGAADFRQPSEPLILDFLRRSPDALNGIQDDGKLIGLGNFGTQYTYHFDIFPLSHDVYFHDSTFIGSGRLSKTLEIRNNNHWYLARGHAEFQLDQKHIRWGTWNDAVSSEIGLCFDWIMEQLQFLPSTESWATGDSVLECMTFISSYVQNHISFQNVTVATECLDRLSVITGGLNKKLETLSNTLNGIDNVNCDQIVRLSILGTVFLFQALQISAAVSEVSIVNRSLENDFRRSATTSARLLLLAGLNCIRQLYDDLQYLAFRERGIKGDRYAAEGWVILIHLVHVARVPRFSFWDVVNSQLLPASLTTDVDAREFEKIWYSMFSLLPLFQIDKNGMIYSDRQGPMSLENWTLPQKLMKRVFELYSTHSRQSPSFNDYCRALFSRIYHLTRVWGWRQYGTIVGTLFDFFALEKLEHLRNEEVHKSPRFLEELHREPRVEIEPEDRCFHIFLKIIATAVIQMREDGDKKNIRNLVIRLLPNHDRQYPKEQAVQERHLASLRNHHDLLCTIFWAAPAELRPSISLISELVNVAISHKEAFLINLRSWTNLTQFVLVSTPNLEAYEPLALWQQNSFDQLISQYNSAEADIEDQLRRLPGSSKNLISAATIRHTVTCNRNEIIDAIRAQVAAVTVVMQEATTMDVVKLAFAGRRDTESLVGYLRYFDGSDSLTLPVIDKALDATQLYIRKLNVLLPNASPNRDSFLQMEEDSQEYGGDLISEFARAQYLDVLNVTLLESLRDMIRKCICCTTSSDRAFMEKLIQTYALVAGTLVTSKHKAKEYFEFASPTGRYSVVTINDQEAVAREYAPLFLAEILDAINTFPDAGDVETCNAISDWLCLLVKPCDSLHYEHRVTQIFSNMGLLSSLEETPPPTSFRNATLQEIQAHRHSIVTGSFRKMHILLSNDNSIAKFYPTLSTAKVRTLFHAVVARVMNTMDRDILNMVNGSNQQNNHKNFACYLAMEIRVYFPNEYQFDRFFSSTIGITSQTDPELFVSRLKSYGLRLQSERGKHELNHLMLGSLKTAAVDRSLALMPKRLVAAMSCDYQNENEWEELTELLLGYLTPAYIRVAFETTVGWLMAEPLLITASIQLRSIAQSDNPKCAVHIARNILRTIINGIRHLARTYQADSRLPLQHEHIYSIMLVTRFINSTFQWLLHMSSQLEAKLNDEILEIFDIFEYFANGARVYIESPVRTFIDHWEQSNRCDLLSLDNAPGLDREDNNGDYPTLDPKGIDLLLSAVDQYTTDVSFGNFDPVTFITKHKTLAPKIMSLADAISINGQSLTILRPQMSDIVNGILPNGGLLFCGIRPLEVVGNAQSPRIEQEAIAAEFVAVLLQDTKTNWDFHDSSGRIAIKIGQSYHHAGQLDHSEANRRSLYELLMNEIRFFLREHKRQTGTVEELRRNTTEFAAKEELWI